ncbi:unnamed protein product (macronuclear) [Paramecium tetraurelia]|uniref:Uncharacterized protein n=1 Tax=Paramecium tetraurelia TaxID=5888 RepID=A0CHV4_PARTE|nr:uncharacterized protein GSPATT00038473001 [Paramecium tetraurelia]CAK70371.1 unnamed protein product [Paramecium tetraurelia]|eukprot:XP_001437768.1 hypothetical protein (macronuclear) [Paramecium tetraurelia strain d4-2]
MDSNLNVLQDEEDGPTLNHKYLGLATFSPKTKTEINQRKNLKTLKLIPFQLIQESNASKDDNKQIKSNSSQQPIQVVQSSNILQNEQNSNKRTVFDLIEQSTKSLSPTKSYYEIASDYTFKLYEGHKKVRFQLNERVE